MITSTFTDATVVIVIVEKYKFVFPHKRRYSICNLIVTLVFYKLIKIFMEIWSSCGNLVPEN